MENYSLKIVWMEFVLAVQASLHVQEPSIGLYTKVINSAANISNNEWETIECTEVYVNSGSGWSDLYLPKHFITKKKKKQSNKTLSKLQWNMYQRGYEMKYVLLFMRFCYIMIVNL